MSEVEKTRRRLREQLGREPEIQEVARELFQRKAELEKVEQVMGLLTPTEKAILGFRYGLLDGAFRTAEEVALEFNLEPTRVRQLEAKALKKLRHPIRSLWSKELIFLPARPEDAADLARLLNSVRHFPQVTPADCLANIQRGPERQAWVARRDDQIAHVQSYLHPYSGQMFWLACQPTDCPALVEICMDFIEHQATRDYLLVASDKFPTLLDCLKARNYRVISQETPQTLDLAHFQSPPDLLDRLRQQGFHFATMAEVREQPGLSESLYELELEMARDVPNAVVQREPSFSEFQQRLAEHREHDSYWALVLQGEQVVAHSQHLRRGPDYFYSFGTGVRRALRGRGLALAAKVYALERIKASGASRVDTSNEVENRAMLHINQKLGYRPLGRQFYFTPPESASFFQPG